MNEEQFEKIERYVHEQMNPQERLQFEVELQTDTELAANTEVYRMVEAEMSGYDEEDALKASLQQTGAGFLSKDEAVVPLLAKAITPVIPAHLHYKKNNAWRGWPAAATIVIAIAAGGIWYVAKENNNPVASVAKSGKKENDTPAVVKSDTVHPGFLPIPPIAKNDANKTTRPGNAKKKAPATLSATTLFKQHFTPDAVPEDKPAVLEEALNYYEHKAYTDANNAFEDANANLDFTTRGQEIPPELTKWYAHYYRGICYLAIDSTGKAITELEQAATTATDSLQPKAQWYLALGYLKGGNIQQTSNLLQQITVNNSSRTYRAKAQSLLTVLENSKK